jgi:hypothetical protein
MSWHPLDLVGAVTARVGGFPLLAVLVNVAYEDPSSVAGAVAPEGDVVGLYGVVVLLSGWVRVRCARLFMDHGHLRGQGPSGVSLPAHPRGRFFV